MTRLRTALAVLALVAIATVVAPAPADAGCSNSVGGCAYVTAEWSGGFNVRVWSTQNTGWANDSLTVDWRACHTSTWYDSGIRHRSTTATTYTVRPWRRACQERVRNVVNGQTAGL